MRAAEVNEGYTIEEQAKMNQYEREEEQLERDLREGSISQAEYNKQLRDMQRDYADEMRGMAEEAAERAYNDTMGDWS